MYIGITIDNFKNLKISDVLKITGKLGVQYVELTESTLNENIEQISSMLRDTRTGFHLPNEGDNGYDFSCKNDEQKIDSVIHFVNLYKGRLNIDYCITHPPECTPDGQTETEQIETLLNNLNRLDCPLVIENIASLSIDEFEQFYQFAKIRLNNQVLGICFDAPHAFIRGDDPLVMIDRFNSSIYSVHLSDCKRKHDLHLPFGLGGDLPIDKILDALKNKDYKGNINLELMPRSLQDVRAVIASYLKVLRKFNLKKYWTTKIKLFALLPSLYFSLKKAAK
ncbi:sugar phosphate isomerase/epimerase [candidate division KSB1 bacterium]|nr:sugar phosphate isomerase/epimerase [candidate division KSB1 bacterium]